MGTRVLVYTRRNRPNKGGGARGKRKSEERQRLTILVKQTATRNMHKNMRPMTKPYLEAGGAGLFQMIGFVLEQKSG